MAAKGTQSKTNAMEKILNAFPGSFIYEKEIRIPMIENGEEIQLKCALTCAKTNVNQGGENILPGQELNKKEENTDINVNSSIIEPTQEEKDNVKRLISALGL